MPQTPIPVRRIQSAKYPRGAGVFHAKNSDRQTNMHGALIPATLLAPLKTRFSARRPWVLGGLMAV